MHCAVQFGFQSKLPEKTVTLSVYEKLTLENGLIHLPDPSTLDTWELDSVNVPSISHTSIERYFLEINKSIGITSLECKALSLGKGLSISGHVGSLLYNPVSVSIPYCFAKTYVVRQTNVREQPLTAWIVVKNVGTVERGYCTCPGGISGACKHVAALLYTGLHFSKSGGNASCTSKPQKWGKPGRFHDPDFLRNVTLKKLKRNADFEEIKPIILAVHDQMEQVMKLRQGIYPTKTSLRVLRKNRGLRWFW